MSNVYINQKHLSQEQKELVNDGLIILTRFLKNPAEISDYSFLVAPFAKAYEGFLKHFLLKLKIINEYDYFSDHFRVGKVLNPALKYKKFSVYRHLEKINTKKKDVAQTLWKAWKQGRNQVFHYFPHNLKRLNFSEAEERINSIAAAINIASQILDKRQLDQDNTKAL